MRVALDLGNIYFDGSQHEFVEFKETQGILPKPR